MNPPLATYRLQLGRDLTFDDAARLAREHRALPLMASDDAVIVVVPRLLARRGVEMPPLGRPYWDETRSTLPGVVIGRFTNVFTGGAVNIEHDTRFVAEALAEFPVALLTRAA